MRQWHPVPEQPRWKEVLPLTPQTFIDLGEDLPGADGMCMPTVTKLVDWFAASQRAASRYPGRLVRLTTTAVADEPRLPLGNHLVYAHSKNRLEVGRRTVRFLVDSVLISAWANARLLRDAARLEGRAIVWQELPHFMDECARGNQSLPAHLFGPAPDEVDLLATSAALKAIPDEPLSVTAFPWRNPDAIDLVMHRLGHMCAQRGLPVSIPLIEADNSVLAANGRSL